MRLYTLDYFSISKQGSEYDKESERSEHSSLEDFDESDISLASDSTDGNINIESTFHSLWTIWLMINLNK